MNKEFRAKVYFIKEVNYNDADGYENEGLKTGYYRTEADAEKAMQDWIGKTKTEVFEYKIGHCIDTITEADFAD